MTDVTKFKIGGTEYSIDHANLTNLSYANSGHTGFMSSSNYVPENTTITVGATGADYTDLQSAIDSLNGKWSSGLVTISIADGTYTQSSTISVNGNTNVKGIRQLQIQGTSMANTILDFANASGDNSFYIFNNTKVIVKDLTIKNVKRGFVVSGSAVFFPNNVKVDTGTQAGFYVYGDGKIVFNDSLNFYVNDMQQGIYLSGGNIISGWNATFNFTNLNYAVQVQTGVAQLYYPVFNNSSVATKYASTKNTINITGGMILVAE